MTKLEQAIRLYACGSLLDDSAPQNEKQKVLDEITPVVLQHVEPQDLVTHAREVYDATADEYAKNPHTKDIIDELVQFMFMLPDGARVLDVGCGVGRDSLFMSVKNEEFRKEHMGRMKDGMPTREKLCIPQKTFVVTGIDNSLKMLALAQERSVQLIQQGLITHQTSPTFDYEDMHTIDIDPQYYPGDFDGVWSCTALFTHTPAQMFGLAMDSVSRVLKSGGVFFASYTNGAADGQHDKLLLSSTGRVKYFSQPSPEEITNLAEQYGMVLKAQMFSDFEIRGKVIKENLFVSQFFKKA